MQYKLAVFIGRFQPYHNGHHSVITNALKIADKVLVLIGSSDGPRSHRNPFTFNERMQMISESIPLEDVRRLCFRKLQDYLYNDEQWIEQVQKKVSEFGIDDKITLVGHSKDNSSYYLKLFPQWDSVDCGNINNLSSTKIREDYFGRENVAYYNAMKVPKGTEDFLDEFFETEDYDKVSEEFEFVKSYKAQWANTPYPPTFVTVDACVVQSGHILLVRRKNYPGKGLWALPGGFLNQEEKIEDAVIRELREETKIKVPAPVLRGNIKANKVFDNPYRSSRGRTITHAFLIHLPADITLPKVKGSDDAEKAKWFPIAYINREMMFEDHMDIIENLTSLI